MAAFNDRYGLKVRLDCLHERLWSSPRSNCYHGVVPIMLNKIEANEAPVINGTVPNYDFIYVEDVARSNIQALISDQDFGCIM